MENNTVAVLATIDVARYALPGKYFRLPELLQDAE